MKKKTLISIIFFVLIFGCLLLTATYYDLQISNLLTKKALSEHFYNSPDTFGAVFEIIGSCPIYFILSFAFLVIFKYSQKFLIGKIKIFSMFLFVSCNEICLFIFFKSSVDYVIDILKYRDWSYELGEGNYLNILCFAFATLVTILSIFSINNLKDETVKKLLIFAVCSIIAASIPSILVNLLLKNPIGRMRYRAMNIMPDNELYGFAAYSRWYEFKGQWIDKNVMKSIFGNTDVLKSCPSGHTASAGAIYCLIMLNDVLHIKNKNIRALNWMFPIIYTGLVATGRIVCGAHFFSDVLLGGTLAFVSVITTREIFIRKFSSFKNE